jgi:hypothetical protein
MLSTAAWTEKDAKYSYERLFSKIIRLFEDPTDPWAIETLEWYQKCVPNYLLHTPLPNTFLRGVSLAAALQARTTRTAMTRTPRSALFWLVAPLAALLLPHNR